MTVARADAVLRSVAATVSAVGLALSIWALVTDASAGWPGGGGALAADLVTTVTWLASGAVTAWALPRSPFGWLLLGGGFCLAVAGALGGQAAVGAEAGRATEAAWLGWAGNWIFFPYLAAAAVIYLLFPGGRLPGPRWRVWVVLAFVADAAGTVLLALTPGPLEPNGPLARVRNPIGGFQFAHTVFPVAVVALNAAFVAGLVALFVRRRAARSRPRHLLTLVLVLAVMNLAVGVLAIDPPGQWVFVWLTVPVTVGLTGAICAGIVWGDLWDIRRTVGRVVVFLLLSGLVVAAFVGIVAAAGALLGNQLVGVTLAALVVCLAFAPAQAWLRTRVERVLYGRRREPYDVLSEFGAALESAGEPADGLQRLAELLASDLRLPGVAVEIDATGAEPVASTGRIDLDGDLRFPIRHRGETVGALVVARRRGETDLGVADRRLLADLARQAGAAAHGIALTEALRTHRAELVAVRERERRRLRRDLHDGVASGLTAVRLTTEVAEDALPLDPTRSARLMGQVRDGVTAVLADLRRVIDGLGPSMLADLGLREAVVAVGLRSSTEALPITTHVVQDLLDLPPAVEEAAFWIVSEALHNVLRHADAHHCHISITSDGTCLHVVVADDGTGLPACPRQGLGLPSIRLRAEEVGGRATVSTTPPAGTRVVADLPITAGVPVQDVG